MYLKQFFVEGQFILPEVIEQTKIESRQAAIAARVNLNRELTPATDDRPRPVVALAPAASAPDLASVD